MYDHKDGITLRKLTRDRLSDLYCLKQESWWGTHKTLIVNHEDQERWFQNIPSDQLFMTAFQGQEAIGIAIYTDIDWLNRSLSISGSIFKRHRVPEVVKPAFSAGLDFAFEILNMRRVQAEVLATNIPSQRLEINHLGFKVEGVRRQAVYKCGMYIDSLILGLLREEWEQQSRIRAYGGSCCATFNAEKMRRAASRAPIADLGNDESLREVLDGVGGGPNLQEVDDSRDAWFRNNFLPGGGNAVV